MGEAQGWLGTGAWHICSELWCIWSQAPHPKTAADNAKVKGRVLKSGRNCFTQKEKENASELGNQVVKQADPGASLKMSRGRQLQGPPAAKRAKSQAPTVRLDLVKTAGTPPAAGSSQPVLSQEKKTGTVRSTGCGLLVKPTSAPAAWQPPPGWAPSWLPKGEHTAHRAVFVCPDSAGGGAGHSALIPQLGTLSRQKGAALPRKHQRPATARGGGGP